MLIPTVLKHQTKHKTTIYILKGILPFSNEHIKTRVNFFTVKQKLYSIYIYRYSCIVVFIVGQIQTYNFVGKVVHICYSKSLDWCNTLRSTKYAYTFTAAIVFMFYPVYYKMVPGKVSSPLIHVVCTVLF